MGRTFNIFFVIVYLLFTACNIPEPACTRSADPEESSPSWVTDVRRERAKIAPFEESLLQKITEQYNIDIAHSHWAKPCLEYLPVFKRVHELTLYPTAYIAGIAMHESAGCNSGAQDWAGGRGLMQITSKPPIRFKQDAATMLGIATDQLNWQSDPLHAVVMGAIFLDSYEKSLGSRPHGLLAYNMGVGGVRKTARKVGWKRGALPEIVTLKPHLRYDKRMKPRIYVQRVLAHVVMMDRAMRGLPIERQETRFQPEDIPGWYPDEDDL